MTDQLTPQQARQRLYEIVRRDVPFDEKAVAALELGTEVLAVDNGHLTRIDPETDRWNAIVSTDTTDGATPPELELDLRNTYCRRAIAEERQIAVHDAPDSGWADDPAIETRELDCYLGTPLIIDGEPRGTVCFVAGDPREAAFSEAETRFAEFLTRLLERELDRERIETDLTSQTTLAEVLNRVLRHNLRNEMSVIRGFTRELAEQVDDARSDTIIDHIDDLIELSETARELERIITSDAERATTDIAALVDCVADTVAANYPSADITVTADEGATTAVLPTFERAVEELLDNAAKHGGSEPTVTVAVEAVPDAVEIVIADDGPGLDNQEIEVLNRGVETPLTHGSGLGLWLAHWVVSSHDGEIDATVTGDGTVMTVSIPRRTATAVGRGQPELTRAPDQYQAAVTQANDAMVVVNDDARIINANAAAGELFGLDAGDLRGRGLTEFLPPEYAFEATWEAIRTPGAERETVRIETADGIDRIIEYTPTSDIVSGQHLVVAREVTERVAREAERERRAAAMDDAPLGIILTDPAEADNPIVYANDTFCELTGYTADEIVGRNCRFLQGEATDADRVERLRRGIEDGEPVSVTLRNYRADGTPFWNRVTVAPVTAGDRELLIGFQEDVSDRIDQPPSPSTMP